MARSQTIQGRYATNPVHEVNSTEIEREDAYMRSSRWAKLYRGVLFQMVLFGALSFVGPAMSDAISNLGGGGLSTPYVANLATALDYVAGCFVSLFGGPLINQLGIKWSCMIAAASMPLTGSAYYVNARYHVDWYLLFAKLLGGFASGFLYVAETTAMLSYPDANERGLYLGIWSAMRNSGSVIGGAINFSTNHSPANGGGIAWFTYLIFVGFGQFNRIEMLGDSRPCLADATELKECTGVLWASLLSPTRRVRRRDGTQIPMADGTSWKRELVALWRHMQCRKTWLISIPAFYSFFYGGTMGTYLSLHFSVRARALSSLITPSLTMVMVIAHGKLLDATRWSQVKRAWISFILWVVPQTTCLIWIGVEYSKLDGSKLDYQAESSRWAEAYLPYLIMFSTGYWTQLSLYWILGTFSTDVGSSSRTGGLFRAFETAGQAVSYALNAKKDADPRIPLYINGGILVAAVPCMVLLIGMVPEQPASTDADFRDAQADDGEPEPEHDEKQVGEVPHDHDKARTGHEV